MADLQNFTMPDKAPDPPQERERARVPDLTFDQGLPANVDAEKTILGAILLEASAFNEAAEKIEADDFSLDSHRRIFLRMSELVDANQAVDIVTLAAELDRYKERETIGGVAYLASLTEGLPRRPVIGEYIRIIKDKAQLRRMMMIFSTGIARAADQSESALSILESAEGELLQIAQDAQSGALRTIYQSVEAAGGVDPYLKSYTEPQLKPGLQTGYSELDRMTGGLQPGELTVIGARPSVGKSAIAINIIENICCGTDKVAALFSLEMSRSSIERRFMASRARVDVKRAMDGWFLSNDEKRKLETALNDLLEARIFIDDTSSATPMQMRAKARRLKQREGRLDIVIVDYIQLALAGQKTSNRQEEVSFVSRSMKAMSKELMVPVVALAQVNRQNEQRQDKRPMLSDLRESGAIEADADIVIFLHRDEMYDRDNQDVKGLADLIVAKNRQGPTGVVKLAYISELTRFDNLARSV